MNKIVTKTIRFIFVMYLRVVLNTRYIVYYSIWDVKNAVDNIDIFKVCLKQLYYVFIIIFSPNLYFQD